MKIGERKEEHWGMSHWVSSSRHDSRLSMEEIDCLLSPLSTDPSFIFKSTDREEILGLG